MARSRRRDNWILSFAGIVAGTIWVAVAAFNIVQSYRSVHWPAVSGEVSSSFTTKRKNGTHEPVVFYVYSVDGRTYESNRIVYGSLDIPFFSGREDAEKMLVQYQTGAAVTVFYDPLDPSYSCIDKSGILTFHFLGGMCGIAFILLGIRGIYMLLTRP